MKKRIPEGMIRFVVARTHVSTPAKKVAMRIARVAARSKHWTIPLVEEAVSYALVCHEKNRRQYQDVMKRGC